MKNGAVGIDLVLEYDETAKHWHSQVVVLHQSFNWIHHCKAYPTTSWAAAQWIRSKSSSGFACLRP